MTCQPNVYIYQGDDTDWNGRNLLQFNVTSDSIDLSEMTAEFILGTFSIKNISLESGSFYINLDHNVTSQLPYGPIKGQLRIFDKHNNVRTVSNTIPFFVTKNIEDVNNNEININVSPIPDIDINIRIGSDVKYATGLKYQASKLQLLDQDGNPLGNYVIIAGGGGGGTAVWGTIEGDLTDQEDLQNEFNGKQDTISDLSTIRSNAQSGASAASTISGYGNIVTHNTSEFLGSSTKYAANLSYSASKLRLKDQNGDPLGDEIVISSGGGSVNWGAIGGTLSDQTDLQNALNAKQDTIANLSTIESGAAAGATAVQPADLSTAISGKADKPTITTDSSSTTVSVTLANNNEYRYTQNLTSLTITLPGTIADDFIAWVTFNSGSTATSAVYANTIKWSGDEVTSNVFVPAASKTYNICFFYDGINVNAIARGV